MKKISRIVFLLLALAAILIKPVGAQNTDNFLAALEAKIQAVAETALKSVVIIYSESNRWSQTNTGSGFLVEINQKRGLIITNEHVINRAEKITVAFYNGSRLPAKLVKQSQDLDLALLE